MSPTNGQFSQAAPQTYNAHGDGDVIAARIQLTAPPGSSYKDNNRNSLNVSMNAGNPTDLNASYERELDMKIPAR